MPTFSLPLSLFAIFVSFAVDLISTALLCLSCVTLEGDENLGAFTN